MSKKVEFKDLNLNEIDISRLTRDYIKYPLKPEENPSKNDLEYLFIELNWSRKELAAYFNRGRGFISNLYKRYGICKTQDQINKKIDKTFKERWGCNPSSTPEVKGKMKNTILKNWGVTSLWDNPSYREKVQKSWNDKTLQDPDWRHKAVQKGLQHQINKYGCIYKQTHLTKQQREWISSKESLKTFIESHKEEDRDFFKLLDEIGVSESYFKLKIRKWNLENSFNSIGCQYEEIIKKELKSLFNIDFKKNKKIIKPLEIDLYNEDLKLGIEFNGNYWHGEKNKNKNYHQMKSKLAEEKGVFLYHIFEYEWQNPFIRTKILNQLRNILYKNKNTIGARKCQIRRVESSEASSFLETNHLQGKDRSSIKIGLYHNDELVALMTFSKPRFNKNYEWELSRFCCLNNYTIQGGASKLFNYFINTYKPLNIISYSDIAKTTGKIYEKLGFKLLGLTDPNYIWYKNHIDYDSILTRYQCQKHKLVKRFPEFKNMSENEIMRKLNYYKIYDSGNRLFIWSS